MRVRLKFFNAAEEDLDEVEGSHFGGLTFEPASLATFVRVTDHHYQFDVTGATPGRGTVQVVSGMTRWPMSTPFDPVAATVVAAP